MRKSFRRSMVMALIAMLLVGATVPVALAAANLNGLIPGTPSGQNARRYTALALEGVAVPVYAFNDATGLTQYRVYGSLMGKTGFFEAELLAPVQPGGEVTLNVKGTVPANDKQENFAMYSAPAQRAQTVVPAGFQQGKSAGIVYIRNYFNQLEYFVYASRDQITWQYFHTDGYSRAMRGGLPVVPESVLPRVKSYQTYLLPQVYRDVHRLPAQYLVNSSDGQPLVVNGQTPVIPENQLPIYIAPTPAPTPRPDSTLPLARGSYGQLVRNVQGRLNALGYHAGYVDGIYGRQTAAAVSGFQQMNGLTLTGTVDKRTYNLMMSSGAIPNPVVPTNTPTATPPQPEAIYEGNYNAQVQTTGGELNLWSIPNPTKRAKYSIAKIPNETLLTGVQKGNNGFSKVIFPADNQLLEGYVDSAYLNFNVPQPAP
ncbi:MAG: peptidoglycan-binding domain-containing protein [Christensenellales bacterium]|jgi:peptidoglycan hydrolase-like protein with peptidoglycan-binding domain